MRDPRGSIRLGGLKSQPFGQNAPAADISGSRFPRATSPSGR